MAGAATLSKLPGKLHARFTGLARAGQVFSSLAAVIGAYWLYWLIAVPLIEPNIEPEEVVHATPEELDRARDSIQARTQSVASYFAEGRWERQDPAIWESDQAQLLFKTLEPMPDGKVKLTPCTVLMFPKNRDETTQPVIMQADEGAVMEFDERIVLKSVDLGKRQLIGGSLQGPIKIRRIESRPGAHDDLAIDTRDIRLVKDRMHTPEPVLFQFGRNRGSGRDMEIVFAAEDGSPLKGGLRGGTMRTLELKYDVQMQLELGNSALVPGAKGEKASQPEPPMQITCKKSFVFDMKLRSASFHESVDVLRLNRVGPADQLNCHLLTVYFESRAESNQAPTPGANRDQLSGLQVRVIEARGDPVTLRAPSQGAFARCMGIDYYPGPPGASGRMLALGPGTMTGNMPRDPQSKYRIQWAQEFRFEPSGTQQVASLRGGAKIWFAEMGEISADELFAWLSPKTPPVGTPAVRTVAMRPPGAGGAPGDGWQLERVMAQGNVNIEAPQLSGAIGRLEAWIERPKIVAAPSSADPQPAPPPPKERRQKTNSNQRFGVRGGLLQIKLVPDGTQFAVSDVTIQRQAHLQELTPKPGEKPLLVEGDRLHVASANTDSTRVTVSGKPGLLEAGGMTLRGEAIEMEKQTNRLWIEGPGRMTMPMDQDLNGQAIAQPQNLDITWQGSMHFQSSNVIFERSVLARSENQTLRTEKLEATLDRSVNFSSPGQLQGGQAEQRPQLAQIRCHGPVFLESRDFDERRQQTRFNQMEVFDLGLNRATGAIDARGPGWLSNVSRGGDQPGLAKQGQPYKPKAMANADKSSDELKYLHVQFQSSMTGNLNRREMTFGEPTKTTYGPVTSWESRLSSEDPASLGPQGMVLDARTLTVRQMPARAKESRAWIEMEAVGNVRAENAQISALGNRLSYSEEKDLIILRGDGRSSAELFQEDENGGPRRELKGAELKYWMKLPNMLANGVESVGSSFLQPPKKKPENK